MSTHNIVKLTMECPRCGNAHMVDIELFCGIGNLIVYQIGDKIAWVPRAAPQNGGRPHNGDCECLGYAECGGCKKDFFVTAKICNDVLVDIYVDRSRQPCIA